MMLRYCPHCMMMTNHTRGVCGRCGTKNKEDDEELALDEINY